MKILALLFISFFSYHAFSQTHFYGRTTGILPHLEFGTGDDRLGGAKMTFLDSNVLLKVVDSFKLAYRVQLSKGHNAYIDKVNLLRVPEPQNKIEELTGNWNVYGDSAFDYVTIQLNEKLPYRSIQQIEPSRLVIDIFGATTNTNWIIQKRSVREIMDSWYEQIEDDVMRVYIDLRHEQHWGHSIYYVDNKLVIKVRRQPAKPELKNLTIAVDAGHGGENMGATGGTSKELEKTLTLLFAKELQTQLLNKNAKVIMTREKDTSISMPERVLFLRDKMPDLLISIHLNSASYDTVEGVSTYYRYIGFRPLSVYILKNLEELGLNDYGNVGNFNFGLNGPTEYPNCLVEVGFLSNRQDEKRILNPAFRKAVAKKIIEGMEEFLRNL